MKIGYARVSTVDQNLARQIEALSNVGVEKIFREKESGAKIENRTQLLAILKFVRESDTVSWIIHLGIGDMKSHLAGLKATFGALRILTERRSW